MYHERLMLLRQLLADAGLAGFIQPVNDPFLGEYVPEHYHRLPWLTGFTGSAGMVAVLPTEAALFVDGRYTLQAAAEVDQADFQLHNSGVTSPEAWLHAHAGLYSQIGYDPWLFSPDRIHKIEQVLADADITLVPIEPNPIDRLWERRPPLPHRPLVIHPLEYAGKTSQEKRGEIGRVIQRAGCSALLLTDLASIAWLLNIRGSDVPHTPVSLHYALCYKDGLVDLFVAKDRVSEDVWEHLGHDVCIRPPDTLTAALHALGERHHTVWVDTSQAPIWFVHTLEAVRAVVHAAPDPCLLPKACKNTVEVAGMRDAHRRDGVALTRFLHWLDSTIELGQPVSEQSAAVKLEDLRREDFLCQDLSFDTISAFGAHGAIVHYRVDDTTNAMFHPGALYLVDSGGQYLNGTTDVTRTVAIEPVSVEHRAYFTRVLKGHISLATAIFPEGTTGAQLDSLARYALWQVEADYDHGTGHGVGSYLGVHEGPQRISKFPNTVALRPGMVLSNEPGYYRTNAYGIRIENLVVVVPAESQYSQPDRRFLRFDTLTLAPIDLRLVEVSMLTEPEREWLNAYHRRVRETLTPHLSADVKVWLEQATRAI